MKITTKQKLIAYYNLPKGCTDIMRIANYLSEIKVDNFIKEAKMHIDIPNEQSYLDNLGLGKQ